MRASFYRKFFYFPVSKELYGLHVKFLLFWIKPKNLRKKIKCCRENNKYIKLKKFCNLDHQEVTQVPFRNAQMCILPAHLSLDKELELNNFRNDRFHLFKK